MNFHTTKCFRYHTLLLLLIIHANLAELQEQDPLLFEYIFDILKESPSISFFEFTNKIMAKVYQLFFNVELTKVLEDMRNKLQLSTNPTSDWFLFKDHTNIKVYGFIGAPYILPTFMTSILFALEYIRQMLFT